MSMRAPGPPFLAVFLGFVVSLSGCTPGFHSVKKQNDASSAESSESADLEAHHRGVVRNSNENTRALIDTIRDQVKPPTCPTQPQPKPECPEPSNNDQTTSTPHVNGKLIVGQLENVNLVEPGFTYGARIDTGAETSSIDARNITSFERNGDEWVRFGIPVPGTKDEFKTLERPISRSVRIIQSSQGPGDDGEHREVVKLRIAIGDRIQESEFTLSSRKNLTHTVLIGRNVLRDVMLVDVGKKFSLTLPGDIRKATKAEQEPDEGEE